MPFEVEPLLDDIDVGELEGRTIDDYRAWKMDAHARRRLPGRREPRRLGRARYADAYERLLARPERGSSSSATRSPSATRSTPPAGSDELDGPAHEIGNCVPHLFDEDGLARAVERIRALAPG